MGMFCWTDGLQSRGLSTVSLLFDLFKSTHNGNDIAALQLATAIVGLHRHAYVHTFEEDIIDLIKDFMSGKFL
jgi:hypothetical protein